MTRSGLCRFKNIVLQFCIISCCVCKTTVGIAVDGVAPVITASVIQEIAAERLWKGLLHFDEGKSQIESDDFFLSSQGRTDPVAELTATLKALAKPVSDRNRNSHALCRFPARALWLKNRHGIGFPGIDCPDFNHYSIDGDIDSISMVFVAGHFKSPASFFGHNLLKFNSRQNAGDELLQPTINYGAIVPKKESPLRYIVMGIFGGYEARFTTESFYRVYQIYAERELRDIWEYPLNLSSDEIALVVAHAWELTNMQLTYYFFRENCAYQIASLINLVLETTLVPDKLPWSLPYNVFDNLSSARTRQGKPFVGKLIYHPSRRSRFEAKYLTLPHDSRRTVKRYIENANSPPDHQATINRLPQLRRWFPPGVRGDAKAVAVVDTLLDYYQFRLRANDIESDRRAKNALQLQRLALPASTPAGTEQERTGTAASRSAALAPHRGQKPTMLRGSLIHNSVLKNAGAAFRFRPAYYDLLNLDAGRLKFSSFSLLDLTVSIFNEKLELSHFKLVEATHLDPAIPGLPDEKKRAWHFSIGAKDDSLACKGCNVVYSTLMTGKSWRVSQPLAGYALIGLHARSSIRQSGHLAVQANIGVTGAFAKSWSLHIQAGLQHFADANNETRKIFSIENRFGNSRSYDVRLKVNRNVATEVSLSASAYF